MLNRNDCGLTTLYYDAMQADAASCFVNFRLPLDLFQRLDDASRAAGVTRAELLRQRIRDIEAVDDHGGLEPQAGMGPTP